MVVIHHRAKMNRSILRPQVKKMIVLERIINEILLLEPLT